MQDANIISYVMRQVPSVISRLQELIKNSADIRIPIISYYEVKRGLLSNNSMHKLALFDAQMKVFGLVPMRETTFELAGHRLIQMLESHQWVVEQHAGARESHHGANLFFHVGTVAVGGAGGAKVLGVAVGTASQSFCHIVF